MVPDVPMVCKTECFKQAIKEKTITSTLDSKETSARKRKTQFNCAKQNIMTLLACVLHTVGQSENLPIASVLCQNFKNITFTLQKAGMETQLFIASCTLCCYHTCRFPPFHEVVMWCNKI